MPFVRRLHQNKHIPSRLREGIDMNDDSETEDLQAIEDANALVVDILTPTGWLQVFEKALNTFRASFENELDPSDSDSIHPIRAWASSQEEPIEIPLGPRKHCYAITSPSIRAESYKHVSDQLTAATTPIQHSPRFGIEHNMAQVKYQMSVLTLDTLKQLQTQRDHTYRYSCSHKYYHRRWPSISEIQEEYDSFDEMNTASTSTTTSLLEAALSALRRFRNHVKTNLMDPGLDNELISDLSRLGFAGDLGMEVTEGVAKDG
ncbi:hypothetical protein FBU30_006869 [Linnemannia zychae]|nr:hypothetical protein FBU30_006869 [Linnemannia zychae]